MIAKCGQFKVWHWSHERRDECDTWSEPETEWHRSWKDEFPTEWQEVIHVDPVSGEKHIADVKTPSGLVVEFQHSYLPREEIRSRQAFYRRMIWIIDAQPDEDSTNAYYFRAGLTEIVSLTPIAHGVRWFGPGRILHKWADPEADVYLDFGRTDTSADSLLWRLVEFDTESSEGIVVPTSRGELAMNVKTSAAFLGMNEQKRRIVKKIKSTYDVKDRKNRDIQNREKNRQIRLF